ncbi:MAG TPA: FAD-dependent oxidoreductase [Micromonosporaceae bacterium]|nr:FAD-dependent oxidoreductase [Micromonosporaceae bacterium]
MKVAVVGGGIFGATTAAIFARAGHLVDLYEKHDNLLHGATRANQGRLHHGYHYPRSPALNLSEHAAGFSEMYPEAVVAGTQNYYCIAAADSKVSGPDYLDFCDRNGLSYETTKPEQVHGDAIDVCVRVPEAFIDVVALRELVLRELAQRNVTIHFGSEVDSRKLDGYDWIVNATYGRDWHSPLRYEVCETAVIALDQSFAKKSFVVMDGPFISLDPIAGQDCHMLYDVVHSVHAHNVGLVPEIPTNLAALVDRGPVATPLTRVADMLRTARRFLDNLTDVEYRGSYFTVRAVLPNVEGTDERPTLIRRDGSHISILSGKVDMAPWAAARTLELATDTTA